MCLPTSYHLVRIMFVVSMYYLSFKDFHENKIQSFKYLNFIIQLKVSGPWSFLMESFQRITFLLTKATKNMKYLKTCTTRDLYGESAGSVLLLLVTNSD